MTKQLTRQEVEAVVERFAGNRIGSLAKFPIMPIRLGEVLEKMQGEGDSKLSIPGMEFDIIELVQLLEPLGLSRSLQEIINESGYFKEWIHCGNCGATECEPCECDIERFEDEYLTSPETNALFSFLQEIL